ncbi:MAG: hypothetical protein Q4A32_07315 [Lachnospiraceae bacterium]|nr:hypothetical protein [Lachnospiraceae bacterium]
MKRKTAIVIAAVLTLSLGGCGESLLLEDATEAADSSASASSSESGQETNATPGKESVGAAAILNQVKGKDSQDEPEEDAATDDIYTANFISSTTKDVIDLVPYDIKAIDPDHNDETDTIQLRINEDSKDRSIASLRFWIDGTINDFAIDTDEYDIFSGAYACDLNFTDKLCNLVTVFTSSKTGEHQTTVYSFANDKAFEVAHLSGLIDFTSVDGAGDFSITEKAGIRTDKYGDMYIKKIYRTNEKYDYDAGDNIQELILHANAVGYYPEENHFAFGYPFSLNNTLTMYINGSEGDSYMTGTLPVNFRGVLSEMKMNGEELDSSVFLVTPEDGWTDSETNIDSPIYAPSSAGSEDFDPNDYTGWVSFSELCEAANEDFQQ